MSKIKKAVVLLTVVTTVTLFYLTRTYLYQTLSGANFPRRAYDWMVTGQTRLNLNSTNSSSTHTEHSVLQNPPNFKDSKTNIATPTIKISVKKLNDLPWRSSSPTDDLPTASTTADESQRTYTERNEKSSEVPAAADTPSMIAPDSLSNSQNSAHIQSTSLLSQDDNNHCRLPQGGYKSWKQGMVTVLEPKIQRNCTKLFAGDRKEAERVKNESASWKHSLSDSEFLQRTRNCTWLREELENNLYNTVLERDFPMAYIFVINTRPQSVFRTLKLLFRPQNTFCINYDSKSSPDFKNIFTNIAKCFENVMICSKQENVIWGSYTIMEAQLNCHHDLLKYRESQPPLKKWKYVVNLCGKELPLMSPHEMVSRLSLLNGSSSILPKKVTSKSDLQRIERKVKTSWLDGKPVRTNEKLGLIPFNLTFYKSSSYSILSAKFVHFLLRDPVALEVHYYLTKSMHSEEHLYATLFMMAGVPGGYDAKLKDIYVRAAHSTWIYSDLLRDQLCHGGIIVNSICIITGGDLPMVMRTSENRTLFHNKYLMEKDHTPIDCLEEMIVEKNKREYVRDCLQ